MSHMLRWALGAAILCAGSFGCGGDGGGGTGATGPGGSGAGGDTSTNTGTGTGSATDTGTGTDTGSVCAVPGGPNHTDCMGAAGIGHLPGKEEAKTNCASCHTADLGKAAGDNCWTCHDPVATHIISHGGKKHKPGASSTNSHDPACINCHAPDQKGLAPCTPCHQ